MNSKRWIIITLAIAALLGISTYAYDKMTREDSSALEDEASSSIVEDLPLATSEVVTELSDLSSTMLSESIPDEMTTPSDTARPAVTTKVTTAATTAVVPSTNSPINVGDAPNFTVYDTSGNTVKLSDYIGKPVVINFWASWCNPCKSEMPDFDEMYQKYSDNVIFLMVNLTDGKRETKDSAMNFISDQGYSFPIYLDTLKSASSAYGIASIPTTVFISKEGNIESRHIGSISKSKLESGIKSIT